MESELSFMPVWQMAQLVAVGDISPVETVAHFIQRIEQRDPVLYALAETDFDTARESAREAEKEVLSGAPLGPLHGIPFGVMDGIKAAGVPNAKWQIDRIPQDAIPVERLRNAGAIFLGNTATYVFGPDNRPRNPWDLGRDPGNSSRGSAAAVAAGLLPFALGMDGAGSTRLPSAWSGAVGLHPSRGLIPHIDYHDPGMLLTASIGPITRSVRDNALVTQVIAGPDGRDFLVDQRPVPDYLAAIDGDLGGMRFAWTNDFGWSSSVALDETPQMVATARDAAFTFRELGAEVRVIEDVWPDVRQTMLTLGRVFAAMGYSPPVSIEWINQRQAALDEALGLPPQPPFEARSAEPLSPAEYEEASLQRSRAWEITTRVLEEHDLLLSVTTPMHAATHAVWGLNGRKLSWSTYSAHTGMFNLLGLPALTVPCGFVAGLPVGLQIVGRPGQENRIFNAASRLEERLGLDMRPPLFTDAAMR